MAKGKKAGWFGLVVLLVIAGIAAIQAASQNDLVYEADASVLYGDTWRVKFSGELERGALEKGGLEILNDEGQKVDGGWEVDGRSLAIEGLKPGSYTVRIPKTAFPDGANDPENIDFVVRESIVPVSSLEELESHFKRIAVRQSHQMKREGSEGGAVTEEEAVFSESESADNAGGGHSETNVQVAGVDEGDIVKTDGDFIYTAIDGTSLEVFDIRDARKPKLIATIAEEDGFHPVEMYLSGNLLAVVGHRYSEFPQTEDEIMSNRIMPTANGAVTARLYDVSDPAAPKQLREAGSEGWYVSSRLNDGILYLISSVTPMLHMMEEEGEVRPFEYDSNAKEAVSPMDVGNITILPGPAGESYTIITAVDLSGGADATVKASGFIGTNGGVYMSAEHLYMASPEHHAAPLSDGATPGGSFTKLFKYTLNGVDVTFSSSAEVPGTPLNQFSMDEHDGHFRIAVTEGNMWDDSNPSESAVHIFDQDMKETGSVTGLGKGERIYSARFMGDRAYVVTFRETDPLYALDLADPANPQMLGELKIPGFSNYLHPLGENHLIGFGQETVVVKGNAPEPQVRTEGMKISLFDVSDMTDPKETAVEVIGGQGTYSDIQYDHKALFEHRERNLYGFPISLYEGAGDDGQVSYGGSGAMVYEVTPEKGIRLKGEIISDEGNDQGYEDYEKTIRRLIYSGETVFAISPEGVASYSLKDFRRLGSTE